MPRGRKKTARAAKAPVRSKKTALMRKQAHTKRFVWAESYTSFLMGIVVVVVAALFIVSYIRQTHNIQQTTSSSTTVTPVPTGVTQIITQGKEKTYTVQRGDDLWNIAEKVYKSGYNWVDIARANHLVNPGTIHAGNVLVLPTVTPEPTTVSPTPSISSNNNVTNTIMATTYTVQKGDDLWDIAIRAYGDGYKWVTIAQANHLTNPGLIFSGDVLSIPR